MSTCLTSNCSICTKEVESLHYTDGKGGICHRHCYERQYPPETVPTLYQIGRGCGDPVLAAQVIAELVDGETAIKIVAEFNRRLRLQWLRRCEP